ncbi:MAG TPA: DUF4097 family beta strand repeat-containing protein [Bryobacteraceae bacterium]|nr:DUF4097 family beta strand repeat-containing protein [Bryobacteraceae bacterium]
MRLVSTLLLALLLMGCDFEDFGPSDRYKEDFHFTLKPADRLSVDNFNGSVEIEGWDEPNIEVTGVKYASTEELLKTMKVEAHEMGSLVELRTVRQDTFHGNRGARYLIRAPRKTIVDRVISSNGSVRVHDMTSAANIHTSNGPIRIENVSGGVDAVTSNGAIDLDTVSGRLSLHTSNGRIRAEYITGQCEAETSNGAVTLRFKDAPNGPTRVHTSNGSVELALMQSPKDDIHADTSNGSISVELPAGTSAHVNARTSNSVSSDFDVTGNVFDHEKHHLEGNIGAGGPLIDLSTHNGGIHLRKGSASVN